MRRSPIWPRRQAAVAVASCLIFMLLSAPALAAGSRLWGTGGITSISGTSGGGITTWAVLNGYASDTETTTDLSISHIATDDLRINTVAAGYDWANRLAVTFAVNKLHVQPIDTSISQQTVGLKLRLAGDVLYSPYGQVSAGAQYMHNQDFTVPAALGARSDNGIDYYAAWSKVFIDAIFGRNVVLNATARATKANQIGLLGFGGIDNRYQFEGEYSAGLFIDRNWLIGAEYRQKPDNLRGIREDDWKSLYMVYAPSRLLTFSFAYVDLGDVAGLGNQKGYFVGAQTDF